MAYKTSYELHHHFPRLAEESGFTFNTHRPRVHIDWNKIKLIDVDNLIRERKFVLIEQHLNDILDCVFESEFDVRILDEGVMKMFRLAQLAVEYQQFCRHYLDRSVYVLREEITSMAKELDVTKKNLHEREEELRKLKKRSRQSKPSLPYGNDNIAAMILKSLSNKGDIFPSPNAEAAQYNKCNFCEKVFLNQLYLQSHLSRRHADVIEIPQKDKLANETNNENVKMNAEIMELKIKLKDMEQTIMSANNKINMEPEFISPENKLPVTVESKKEERNVKDAEVSTNNEEYLLDKFEQWKKEEHEKYDKEIQNLRSQIMETINAIKDKQIQQPENKDSKVIEQLQSTIVQQGAELLALKQELNNSKIVATVKEDNQTNREAEAQIAFWSKRAEAQSQQCEALLQKLNDVAKDAKESRESAETERVRATQLQALLQQSLQGKLSQTVQTSTDDISIPKKHVTIPNNTNSNKLRAVTKKITDRQTLENLHKKAQELLNIGSLSSSSSDASSESEEKAKPTPPRTNRYVDISPDRPKTQNRVDHPIAVHSNYNGKIEANAKKRVNAVIVKDNDPHVFTKAEVVKPRNEKNKAHMKKVKEAPKIISGSPVRVVRAKLTEEVNNRLVSFGVDPLKSRLPRKIFQRQRMELQQINEIKAKKSPSYEKIKYGILAYLDANTEEIEKKVDGNHEYVSPSKMPKSFRGISSVISNVKTKALSLVKLNDSNKQRLRSINADVTKKAMTFLKSTPSDSGHETPESSQSPDKIKQGHSTNNLRARNNTYKYNINEDTTETKHSKITPRKWTTKQPKDQELNYESEDDSDVSEHDNHHTTTAIVSESSKSIEHLIKSPARRPASADVNTVHPVRKYTVENGTLFMRTQSATNLSENATHPIGTGKVIEDKENSSEDIESFSDSPIKKVQSIENIQNVKHSSKYEHSKKQTKGVLKNASSTSSLNKKKVLFDMDAIQMKSVSASPSQSLTEKSDGNEKYELGLVNLDGEEWDISSLENEPLKNDTKLQINTRASPKIAELKKTIESQLARRNDTPSTAIVGGVDILAGPMAKAPSIGGSNTSLGSSILDDSEAVPTVNRKAFVKPRNMTEKDDSELDISEFSIDGITVTNKNESF